MTRTEHIGIFSLILMLWIGTSVYASSEDNPDKLHGSDVNGLIWGAGEDTYRVSLQVSVEQEIKHYTLQVRDHAGKNIYENVFSIDWDMFGGGFVVAMQVDDDPDLEIVVVDKHKKGHNIYLDLRSGEIVEVNLAQASAETQKYIADRYSDDASDTNIGLVIGGLFTLVLMGFMLYAVFWICRFMFRLVTASK